VGLNVLTPRGQQAVRHEERAAAIWEFHNPTYRYCPTPKDSVSSIDAIIVERDGLLRGVVEAKVRYNITEEGFADAFRNEWLVTMDKLIKGAEVARLLCVPYYGFLFLHDSDLLLTIRIADSEGHFCVPFRCESTLTKKNVNGGEAVRPNAFIPMATSRKFKAPQPWSSTCLPSSSGRTTGRTTDQ
jgi:hypothetical protein